MATDANSYYSNMAKNMADEMEKRRLDWQKEVERMQQDFFKNVKMDQSGKDRNDVVVSPQQPIIVSSPKSPSTPDYRRGVVTGDDVDGIQHLPDGRTVFRARFDVRDFEPDEVSVRLEDIDEDSDGQAVSRLVVSARHVDEERPQDRFGVAGDAVRRPSYSISSPTSDISEQPRRRSREFNRRVSLPPNVDADRLISRLSYDGLLTVEAPLMPIADVALDRHRVQPPRYETLTSSSSLSAGRDANRRASEIPHSGSVYSRSRDDRKNSLPTSATTGATVASPRSYDVIEIDGNRLLKMVLDLGTTDFAPEDVRVIVHGDRKLGVVARRETMLPATGKTTRRQFSRELDVNDSIDRSTVAAALDTGTGRLLIVAAFKNRESNDSTYSRWAPGSRSAIAAVQEVVQSAAGRASSTRLCDVELR